MYRRSKNSREKKKGWWTHSDIIQVAEKKIMDIEEELKVVGQNLQLLEVAEEQSRIREEKLQTQIMDLRIKLKASEYRGENAEMNIQRLNVRIDQIEEDLVNEKLKIKKISDDLDQTFEGMINISSAA